MFPSCTNMTKRLSRLSFFTYLPFSRQIQTKQPRLASGQGSNRHNGGPISANTGLSQRYQYWHVVHQYVPISKLFLRLEKTLKTSDSNWRNNIVCGSLLKKLSSLQCSEVWNKVCQDVRYPASITCLCHTSLITSFSGYYICTVSANGSDIGIFLLPVICFGISPKTPNWSGPTLDYISQRKTPAELQ